MSDLIVIGRVKPSVHYKHSVLQLQVVTVLNFLFFPHKRQLWTRNRVMNSVFKLETLVNA